MAQIVPHLQLDIGGMVLVDQSARPLVHQGLGRQILRRVGAFVRQVDLFVAQRLAAADHDEQRRQAAQRGLHDGADQGVRD